MTEKKKVIIDTDPGIDDSLALMLAGKSNNLDILGVTIAAGNVENQQCTQNALDVLHLIERDDIPVYTGATKPLKREPINARETHGSNGIGNVELEHSKRQAKTGALEFLKTTLEQNPGTTLIALGPLTNIALLLEKYPEVKENIKELVLMGGTYKSHGNCSPVAEFNFWFDPDAAKYVFENLNKPITMTGLDVTRKALLTPNYAKLIKNFDTKLADTIYDMTQFYTDFHWDREGVLGCVINDPLAVAQVIDPSICTGINGNVEIITDGPAIGMSMVDTEGILNKEDNCYILTNCDHKRFFKLFMKTLFPEKEIEIDKILDNELYGN